MSDNTIVTIVWGLVAAFIGQGILAYSLFRLAITGKPLFERRSQDEDEKRTPIHSIGRHQ
jgi:hypothetical protein